MVQLICVTIKENEFDKFDKIMLSEGWELKMKIESELCDDSHFCHYIRNFE